MVGAWDHAAGGGQHMSSQLAGVVASNHLAHSYASFHTAYNDTGLWGTYAVAPAHALDDIVYVIEQEYVRLAFSPTVWVFFFFWVSSDVLWLNLHPF